MLASAALYRSRVAGGGPAPSCGSILRPRSPRCLFLLLPLIAVFVEALRQED